MREKQELLKKEGERDRDSGSLSLYTRWGGVIRDDGNIKSGELSLGLQLHPFMELNLKPYQM